MADFDLGLVRDQIKQMKNWLKAINLIDDIMEAVAKAEQRASEAATAESAKVASVRQLADTENQIKADIEAKKKAAAETGAAAAAKLDATLAAKQKMIDSADGFIAELVAAHEQTKSAYDAEERALRERIVDLEAKADAAAKRLKKIEAKIAELKGI